MPKSFRNLWPEVVDWANLLIAYQRCRRRKRYKMGATEFDSCWESNLLQLQRELSTLEYRPGPYRHFFVYEPKERRISAAPFRDRVVHHAIINVMEPRLDRRFIFDSYACRRGKGTHRAIRRAQYYMRKYPWFLKTDIVKFFPNVDHEILMGQLCRVFPDERLLTVLSRIIESGEGINRDQQTQSFFPGDDLFALTRKRGLPIGNLTSQFLANAYLDPLDHFIKETLRVPGYVRYADDLLLLDKDKARLAEMRTAVSEFLQTLRLRLHRHKTQIAPSEHGLTYLGFRVRPNSRRLSQDNLRRFRRRTRRQRWLRRSGRIATADVKVSLMSWLRHGKFGNCKGVTNDLLNALRF